MDGPACNTQDGQHAIINFVMNDKLDLIINLLTEINEKLKTLVHDQSPPKKRRKSAKQEFHERMLAELEVQRAKDKVKAKKMFAKQIAEIEEKKRKLGIKPDK